MATSITIRISDAGNTTQTSYQNILRRITGSGTSDDAQWNLNGIARQCEGMAAAAKPVTLQVAVGSGAFAAASGTVAPAQASITAGDILYVGSVGFVATDGAVTPGAATFDMRTSTAAVCTSIAAQINAHASLTGVVTATANATTVTIAAAQWGAIGNHITLAKVNTNNAALVLNGLANTVLQSTLLNGTGGTEASTGTYPALSGFVGIQ